MSAQDETAAGLRVRVTLADLQRVCSTAAATAALAGAPTIYDAPWRGGGFTWACNGRLVLRVPDWMVPEAEAGRTPEKLAGLPWADCRAMLQQWTWQDLPRPAAAVMEGCALCAGSGRVKPVARGVGESARSVWVAAAGTPMDPGVRCVLCDGVGERETVDVVLLDRAPRQLPRPPGQRVLVPLAGRDLRLARTLPGPLLVRYPDTTWQREVPISFAGGAGEGWIKLLEDHRPRYTGQSTG